MHVGVGPEDAHLKTALSAVPDVAKKAAAGLALCQTWMGFPMQQQSTAESCSAARRRLHHPGREQAQGITQPQVTRLTYAQHARHPSHFCPVWDIFAHTVAS